MSAQLSFAQSPNATIRQAGQSVIPFMAAILSGTLAVMILGSHVIDPSNTSWIVGDFMAAHFGWVGYRLDPAPAWPMLSSQTSWPLPMSVAMFDLIPLVAFPLKLASGWLPQEIQYFGLVFVANAALQGMFGCFAAAEAARGRLGPWRMATFCITVGVLFATAPILYHRFLLSHSALGTHWPLIAALWLYLRAQRVSVFSAITGFAVLLAITGAINPYLVVMVALIYSGAIFGMVLSGRWKTLAVLLSPLPLLAALASMLASGFIALSGEGVVQGEGYGFYSANLLAPINPKGLPSAFLGPIDTHEGQYYEGYGYLGLGAILLIAAGVLVGIRRRPHFSIWVPLVAVATIGFALALSTTVRVGIHTVAEFSVPHLLSPLTHFRSSGRFIWLFDYAAIFLGVLLVVRAVPRYAVAVVLGCSLVQAVDTLPLLKYGHEAIAKFSRVRFFDKTFEGIGKNHDVLLMTPPWYCGIGTPGYSSQSFWPIADLVIKNELKTNNFYSGRLPRDQQRYHCREYLAGFPDRATRPRTLYLFTLLSFRRYGGNVAKTHACELAEEIVICRGDLDKVGRSDRLEMAIKALPSGS